MLVGWLVVLFYGISTIFRSFNAELNFKQFSLVSKQFYLKEFRLALGSQFSSIWPIDRTLSGAITPDQSGPGSDGNKWALRIPQSFSITGTSSSDCLVSYLGHSLRKYAPSADILQLQPTGQLFYKFFSPEFLLHCNFKFSCFEIVKVLFQIWSPIIIWITLEMYKMLHLPKLFSIQLERFVTNEILMDAIFSLDNGCLLLYLLFILDSMT